MRFKLVAAIFVLLGRLSFPQYAPGARQISLSNSAVAGPGDAFSLFDNPAGLSLNKTREFGVFYSPSPFGLKELANGSIVFKEPLGFGTAAAGATVYGFELYKETRFIAGFSAGSSFIKGGAAVVVHRITIKNYGSSTAFILNAGILINLMKNFRWGFAVQNINGATIGSEPDQLPVVLESGIGYDFNFPVTFNLALKKELFNKLTVLSGIEYRPVKYIAMRTGFGTGTSKVSAGIGIIFSPVEVDYAVFTHPDLGITHQIGMLVTFGTK